jgi:hypothetical protein
LLIALNSCPVEILMDADPRFQYFKAFVDVLFSWPAIGWALLAIAFLYRSRLKDLPVYVAELKFGDINVKLRDLQQKVTETQTEVEILSNELQAERERYSSILQGMNPHAPVAEMESARQAIKALAPGMTDLGHVLAGLEPGATDEAFYGAAEVIRAKRDVKTFDKVVACLDRLAGSPHLESYRLHAVWTLTSALHKLIMDDAKSGQKALLTSQQLSRAAAMLKRLAENPRVENDRPDDPDRGIRGPIRWSLSWIEQARKNRRER